MRRRAFLLALLGALLGGCHPAPAPPPREAPYVVLVSLDGFRHDYPERFPTPHLRRLAARGARGAALVPVFPTKTFSNHYSLATGMYAGRHGVVANEVYDPERGALFRVSDTLAVRDPRWYGGEPIWVTAERQGMRTATFFWPGSEAPIGGVRPTYWKRYDASIPEEARVDTVLSWLRLPPERRPHLLTLYLSRVDEAAHRHGPESPQAEAAVRRADAVLGRLLEGIAALPVAERVNVVVVSDHGLRDVSRGTVYALEDYLPLEGVRTVNSGPFMQLFFGGDTARRERAHAALRGRLPHARVFRREEIPEALHLRETPRAGDLLIVMDPPHQVEATRRPAGWRPSPGNHGYDPSDPEMHGIFVAAGPGVREGARLPAFENVHVYPLLARLLGLRPAPGIEGRLEVVAPALRR